ncbi:hypothetical protein ORV05_08555 [Amycolatopsis cynarae]|uniref:Uncharacterized protein n=1 Tax=Amycolatopsis cynarae TaxID=2995223 RepID=A0ABY7BEF9_9PSEU|nr:hypothetical protein [Amycolatopsis sp. HUAS 11-8]WAL70023.1 hypothetical protein ORV05_08555 [Amycolatopsis sp. HUAS 11-8]
MAASLGAGETCYAVIRDATTDLVNRAHTWLPSAPRETTCSLVTAVSLATEGDAATARRLLGLALVGVLP